MRAIVPPTVKEGTQRVRVCLHAGNGAGDVEGLVGCLRAWVGLRLRLEGERERERERDVGGVEKEEVAWREKARL